MNLSAIQVANWFIENQGGVKLTNLKLQELLYISYGIHAADFNEPLFYDHFEAYRFGVVVQSVFHQLPRDIDYVLTCPIRLFEGYVPRVGSDSVLVLDTLGFVLHYYGKRSVWELREKSTQKNSAWDIAYDRRRNGFQLINKSNIVREFGGSLRHLRVVKG